MIAMRDLWTLSDAALDHSLEEMEPLQARAEKTEMALEDTRATLKNEVEATRLRAEKAKYALEVAQRKAANELDNALVAEEKQKMVEEKLEAVESKMYILKDRLHSTAIEVSVATERAEKAEEVARQSDVEIAILKVAVIEAEREAAEAKEKVTEAEGKIFEVEKRATEAVENFRKSKAFSKELAESTAFAYEGGFQDCKEKIQRLYDLEGIEELEPDEVPEDDDPAQ